MTNYRKFTFTLDTIVLVENFLSQVRKRKPGDEISRIRRSIYFFLSEVSKEARDLTPEDYRYFLSLFTNQKESDYSWNIEAPALKSNTEQLLKLS